MSFQNIANFRDVSESLETFHQDAAGAVGKRRLFRSARPDFATKDDIKQLSTVLGIKTIIDLRNGKEVFPNQQLRSVYPVTSISVPQHYLPIHRKEIPDEEQSTSTIAASLGTNVDLGCRTLALRFVGSDFRRIIWERITLSLRLKMLLYACCCRRKKWPLLVGREVVTKGGLSQLNRDLVDHCQHEIKMALDVLADETNYPILVHCTQGKDRTGLIIALTLSVLNVSRDAIASDYAKSEQGLESQRQVMLDELLITGLTPEFNTSPAEMMKETLAYIDERYGSVTAYLTSIGFSLHQQMKLRHCLIMPAQVERNTDAVAVKSDQDTAAAISKL